MLEALIRLHEWVNGIVWGPPLIIFLIGVGITLTIVTRGIQFRKIGFVFREVLGKLFKKAVGEGTVTPFQALATALASTVGVGNIAGVATAITLGGPGAVFWLAFSGLIGMATKFSEIAVALYYRERDAEGVMRGGAMYVLRKGLNMPRLGNLFALLIALAALGAGNMVQANSVAEAIYTSFGIPHWITGILLAIGTAAVILGGIRRIAEVTEFLVPFMCLFYITGGLVIILRHASELPGLIALVVESAFTGHAAVGGFAGATVAQALRYGIARGLFTNEAGLGSAPIAHSSAVTDHPVRQACYGIFEVFVDTIVICNITAFVILTTDVWHTTNLTGAALSATAFEVGLPGTWGHLIVTVGLICFAFSTLLGWAYYGETGATFLFGTKAELPYRLLWVVFVFLGAIGSLQFVWSISDTLNGLMAFPNLVAVLGSIPLLRRLVKEFFNE